MDSLNTLDYNPTLFNIKTLETIKNELNDKSRTIIKETAKELSKHEDKKISAAAKTYLATSSKEMDELGEIDLMSEQIVKDEITNRISKMIDATSGLRNGDQKDIIKQEILAAL